MFSLFKRKNKNQIKERQIEVLNLILAGENPVFKNLKRQISSNFILGVTRTNIFPIKIAGISVLNEKSRYQLQFHLPYEKSKDYLVNEDLSFNIDDLVVINKKDGREIYFDLQIYEGEISNLLGVVTYGDFPFDFEIGEWDYYRVDENGNRVRTKERVMPQIPSIKKDTIPTKLTEFQEWLLSLRNEVVIGPGKEKLDFIRNSATSLKDIKAFETRNKVTLPKDFHEFLNITNGCTFFGVDIFKLNDFFKMDDPNLSQFIPFHAWLDGNFTALNVEDNSIFYLCHDPFGYAKVGNSFEDWIRRVENEIRNNGQLYHPNDQKKDSIYGNVFSETKKF